MSNDTKTQIDLLLKKIPASGSFDSAVYARRISKLADEVDISGPKLTAEEEEQVLSLILRLRQTAPNLPAVDAREIALKQVLATKAG
jgi:hypothetical protein